MINEPNRLFCRDGTIYTIRSGDILYALAQRYNTTVEAILQANPGLDPANLQVGRQICIPEPSRPSPRPDRRCPGVLYTVRAGDNFYNIARQHGVSLQNLLDANPDVNPDQLQIGQQICVPAMRPPRPPRPQPTCSGRLYTVQAGDTFYQIARRFGFSLNTLLAANPDVDPDVLRVGQEICLPSPGERPPIRCRGSIYRVQAGETLYGIAQRQGIPFDTLLAANPQITDANMLQIGDPVCIPR